MATRRGLRVRPLSCFSPTRRPALGAHDTGNDIMRMLMTVAFAFAVFVTWPATPGESAQQSGVRNRPYTWGPPTCMRGVEPTLAGDALCGRAPLPAQLRVASVARMSEAISGNRPAPHVAPLMRATSYACLTNTASTSSSLATSPRRTAASASSILRSSSRVAS